MKSLPGSYLRLGIRLIWSCDCLDIDMIEDKFYIVKYLDNKDYNIAKGCKTLKIQTLENCRELEGMRQDISESLLTTYIQPGEYKDRPLKLPGAILGGKGGSVTIFGEAKVTESFNAYLYSTAILTKDEVTLEFGKKRFGDDVCDFFYFKYQYLRIFAELIALELQSRLKLDDFQIRSKKLILDNGGMEKLQIQWLMSPISYMDVKDIEVSQGLPDYMQRMMRLIFSKPIIPFRGDCEFRFVWVPTILVKNELTPIIVNKKPIIIDLPSLQFQAD